MLFESTPTVNHSVVPKSLLTEENCLSSSRIRAFLRLSRIATDDTIRQHLNDKTNKDCQKYFDTKIVPQWEARTSAIMYCSNYSHDLRQKTLQAIAIAKEEPCNTQDQTKTKIPQNGGNSFNLRLDPYALRNYTEKLKEHFLKCDLIDNWVKNEQTIEGIVREGTVEVLNQKCFYGDWMRKFNEVVRSRGSQD
jgi:hypothetical protein